MQGLKVKKIIIGFTNLLQSSHFSIGCATSSGVLIQYQGGLRPLFVNPEQNILASLWTFIKPSAPLSTARNWILPPCYYSTLHLRYPFVPGILPLHIGAIRLREIYLHFIAEALHFFSPASEDSLGVSCTSERSWVNHSVWVKLRCLPSWASILPPTFRINDHQCICCYRRMQY